MGMLQPKHYDDMEYFSVDMMSWENWPDKSLTREVLETEEMLWDKFSSSSTDFWRDPLEREQPFQPYSGNLLHNL